MAQEIERVSLSANTLMRMQDYSGVLRDLSNIVKEYREEVTKKLNMPEHEADLPLREHLGMYKVRFEIPQRWDATVWVSTLLTAFTVIVVQDDLYDQLIKFVTGDQEVLGRPGVYYEATSAFNRDEINAHVISWRQMVDQAMDVDGYYLEALNDVKRVVLYGVRPDNRQLDALSYWSRRGRCCPTLAIIN